MAFDLTALLAADSRSSGFRVQRDCDRPGAAGTTDTTKIAPLQPLLALGIVDPGRRFDFDYPYPQTYYWEGSRIDPPATSVSPPAAFAVAGRPRAGLESLADAEFDEARAKRHVRASDSRQNPVFEVPLRIACQIFEILRVADVLVGQARMDSSAHREHLAFLLFQQGKHKLVGYA